MLREWVSLMLCSYTNDSLAGRLREIGTRSANWWGIALSPPSRKYLAGEEISFRKTKRAE
ncbi:MAG: hypothetical protein P4L43_20410 [Syntrophobacteraceae bacterium]|nr:hypothetical protein [Syntrophobacteraceae bacterium]